MDKEKEDIINNLVLGEIIGAALGVQENLLLYLLSQ